MAENFFYIEKSNIYPHKFILSIRNIYVYIVIYNIYDFFVNIYDYLFSEPILILG